MGKGVIWRIKKIFTHPSELFREARKERGVLYSLTWLLALMVWNSVANIAVLFGLNIQDPSNVLDYFGWGDQVFNLGVMLLGVLIAVPILHLSIKLFRGEADITMTFKIVAYSMTPYLLLSATPFIGQFFIFFTLFLVMFGIWCEHMISPLKSALSLLTPLLIAYMIFQYVGLTLLASAITT